MKTLPRFTFGMGDRFGLQGEAQLRAVLAAQQGGIAVAPVWNKSFREHSLIGTEPHRVREEADAAVTALGYSGDYFVDADHITMKTVDLFIASSDFFTLDVAENLGSPPSQPEKAQRFAARLGELGEVDLGGSANRLVFDAKTIDEIVGIYGGAVETASALYQQILSQKDADSFAVEVSMDETEVPQQPKELLGILCLLALEGIPVQTIAPKFSGRFNKGVDYVGALEQFRMEFEADLLVVQHATGHFGLPASLKLSVHSGSDKFSLYPIIRELLSQHGAGLHIKTAGTTWLEEVIGLAEAGGAGLECVKQLYRDALGRLEELTAPYSTVLDIDPSKLPTRDEAANWSGKQVVLMLEHNPQHPAFNPSLRQLFHVAFKLAAQMDERYLDLLRTHAPLVNQRVYNNLYANHLLKVFPQSGS